MSFNRVTRPFIQTDCIAVLVSGRCFWGNQYPDQEVSDDMENYRGLELLHEGMCLRHKTWRCWSIRQGPRMSSRFSVK